MFKRLPHLLLVMTAVLLAACAQTATAPEAEEEAAEAAPITIGLLPVLDSLPYYIAAQNGYFAEEGVEVTVAPVSSPVERDQLMQAGELDAMLNELTTTAVFNQEEVQIQSVITARVPQDGGPVFRILAAPGSGIAEPADLAGVPIAVSVNTIIEYVTDQMLTAEGLSDEEIVVESVPVIPERFQLLMSGDIQAATLPDPLAQAAVQAGAINVIDDSAYPEFTVTVLSFNIDAIENNPAGVEAFLRAWERAVADLNADPEAYRSLFIEEVNVPEPVQDTYDIPPFPTGSIPTQEQWDEVNTWLIDNGLIEEPVSFEDSVTDEFLPSE